MRWTAALVTAGVAEAASHLLSIGWGFAVLVAAFVFVAVRMSSAATAQRAKVMGTEQRLAAHIIAAAPAINLQANGGTIGGSLTVAGNHTVTGAQTVSGQINGSTVSISGGMTDFGHTTHGNLSVDNNVSVSGDHSVTGQVSSGTLAVAGGATVTGNLLGHGQINADGNMSANNFGGPYQGGQGAVTVPVLTGATANEVQLFNGVNGCISRLNSSGLI